MNNLLNKKSTLCVKCGSKFKFRKEEKKKRWLSGETILQIRELRLEIARLV
jgi:hypothetical protein